MRHCSALFRAASAGGVVNGNGNGMLSSSTLRTPVATPRRAPRVGRSGFSPSRTTRNRSIVVVRITNTGSELVPSDGKGKKNGDRGDRGDRGDGEDGDENDETSNILLDDDFIDLGPQYQVPDPEKGPLEQRVGVQYLDALFSDDISEEDAAYWFTSPPGGWNTERRVLRKAVPVECPPVPQGLRPADEPGASERRDLLSMREGEELTGTIVGGSYTTGLHVDVGCRWDGLIPISVADHGPWKRLRPGVASAEGLNVGDEVRVRVGKIIYAPLCRFPLVLELLGRPEFADGVFADPKSYGGAFDLRGAPDSRSGGEGGLSGVELAAAMDALTGGAWSGGAACEVTAVPSSGYSQENVVAEERLRLEEEVEQWQRRKKKMSAVAAANAAAMAAAAARARNAAAAAASASARPSSDEERDDGPGGGGGERGERGDDDGQDAAAAPSGDFGSDDDDGGDDGGGNDIGMMFADECGHTDLDAAIARLL